HVAEVTLAVVLEQGAAAEPRQIEVGVLVVVEVPQDRAGPDTGEVDAGGGGHFLEREPALVAEQRGAGAAVGRGVGEPELGAAAAGDAAARQAGAVARGAPRGAAVARRARTPRLPRGTRVTEIDPGRGGGVDEADRDRRRRDRLDAEIPVVGQ